jgi:hypothetical protein
MAARSEQGTRQDRATCAAAVLNNAALIASDCDIRALARNLCCRQYQALAASAPLPAWAASLAMQPVLNIVRQVIREGDGERARATLEGLHQAALSRTTAVVEGIQVDFSALTSTAEACRETRALTWSALLSDGIRALAHAARWKEAADLAARYRGTGNRLLDGRQAAILALLTTGRASAAAQMTEQSTVAEPWEYAVQAVLRVMCQRGAGQVPAPGTATMTAAACALARAEEAGATVTRTRIGLIALDLADDPDSNQTRALNAALVSTGNEDAYAARDLLASSQMARSLTISQRSELETLVQSCGLGAGEIPARLHNQLVIAAEQAESILTAAVSCRD